MLASDPKSNLESEFMINELILKHESLQMSWDI